MPNTRILKQYTFGDIVVEYVQAIPSSAAEKDDFGLGGAADALGLRMYPAAMADQLVAHREYLEHNLPMNLPRLPAWNVEPLVQFKLMGDSTSGYHNGISMRNSASLDGLTLESQREEKTAHGVTVITRMVSPRGFACEHHLHWEEGTAGLTIHTVFINQSAAPLTLEMLASFSLSQITPFAADDAPERLFIHRFRSYWSAEGRHERTPIEALHMERSWLGAAVRVERFGQVGSMPVHTFFPFAALEDSQAGVLWGAQLETPGSWQMEFYRKDDTLSLSGGLADREFGHWTKTVAPGESFETPAALVSTVKGDIDDLGARLVELQEARIRPLPAVEEDLPVACNEWCTSWGKPTHDLMIAMADRLKGSGVKYLVIDCGWFNTDRGGWYMSQGDWDVNKEQFPLGLGATAQAIRERGLIPGLWYEFEVVGLYSPRFEHPEHVLTRDGLPITAAGRHFWDMRDPWVVDYLNEKVIKNLRDNGFGYIKVDYNETIGIGADGADSLGEGLRQHMEGVVGFFDKMRDEIPDLVIEDCSSGGHRLAPGFLKRVSQASFSDAHETLSIPIIAASLHRLMPPRQSQIWAVLHRRDSLQRLTYSLSAGFLGRLCLSGEIFELSDEQWERVLESIRFYQKAAPVIRQGATRLVQHIGLSWEHPQGAQAAVRVSKDQRQALVVCHSFEAPLPAELTVTLPEGQWQLAESFPSVAAAPDLTGNVLHIATPNTFEAQSFLLKRVD